MSTIIRVEGGKYVEEYNSGGTIEDMFELLDQSRVGRPNRAFIWATKDGIRFLISVAHIVDVREAE